MISLSPKERFIADSRAADAHGELCRNPAFIRACEAAWAEFAWKQSPPDVATGHRMDGARQFLTTFLNLGEAPLAKQLPSNDTLRPT